MLFADSEERIYHCRTPGRFMTAGEEPVLRLELFSFGYS